MFFVFLFSTFIQAQTVSEVVGSVDSAVITSRDVRADWIVEKTLFEPGGSNYLSTDVNSTAFNNELNRILMENVVHIESKLFKVVEVKDGQVKSSISNFKEKLSAHSALADDWKKLDITSTELYNLISRKLQAKSFIEFKAKASLIPVTEAEAFNYYKNNRKKFGTKPYKDFKDSIKNFLAKQQADQRLSEWFGVLKKKYQVRKVYVN